MIAAQGSKPRVEVDEDVPARLKSRVFVFLRRSSGSKEQKAAMWGIKVEIMSVDTDAKRNLMNQRIQGDLTKDKPFKHEISAGDDRVEQVNTRHDPTVGKEKSRAAAEYPSTCSQLIDGR